jgi:hypothetical protein
MELLGIFVTLGFRRKNKHTKCHEQLFWGTGTIAEKNLGNAEKN